MDGQETWVGVGRLVGVCHIQMWLRDARDLNQTRARDGVGRSKPTPEILPWWKHEHLVIDQLQGEEEEEEQ